MIKLPFSLPLLCGFLLWQVPGCGPDSAPGPRLTDRQFADLAVEVLRLHRRYAEQTDSLALHRGALFRRHGVTREEVERFIAARDPHPEAWKPVLEQMQGELAGEGKGLDTLEGEPAAGIYRKAVADTARTQDP